MASAAGSLVMRSLNASAGAAAKGTTAASSTWNLRSGISLLGHDHCFFAQLSEKTSNLLPYLCSAGKPAPMHPYQPHELVAFVHGCYKIFGLGGSARMSDAVHQQRLDVGFHTA